MESNIFFTHLTSAALFAYLLDLLQRWEKVPWITRQTTKLNTAMRLLLSSIATLGIHWTWGGTWSSGRELVIAIPALASIGHALFNLAGQYALQHGWEKLLLVPMPAPPAAPAAPVPIPPSETRS